MRISDWSSDVCSSDLAAGALLREHPDCYLQTHLSENRREIETVRRLFPWAESYTAVYERFGLLGPRSLFGHCIHLGDEERRLLSGGGSVAESGRAACRERVGQDG